MPSRQEAADGTADVGEADDVEVEAVDVDVDVESVHEAGADAEAVSHTPFLAPPSHPSFGLATGQSATHTMSLAVVDDGVVGKVLEVAADVVATAGVGVVDRMVAWMAVPVVAAAEVAVVDALGVAVAAVVVVVVVVGATPSSRRAVTAERPQHPSFPHR